MAAQIDSLVDELERSYTEAQERMNDPDLYSDRNAAAEAGRRLKERMLRIVTRSTKTL